MTKIQATASPSPCWVTMATQVVAQGLQTLATTPPAPTRPSTAEVSEHVLSQCQTSPAGVMRLKILSGSSTRTLVSTADPSDRQLRSASLSSDDVSGLSQSQLALSRSSTLPYDHAPQRAQPQRGGGPRPRTRPSSPGSEMVTLEEFLHESNVQSPPMVKHSSSSLLKWILRYSSHSRFSLKSSLIKNNVDKITSVQLIAYDRH